MALKIAMVIPPSVNLNTPYAAGPRLTGWLRSEGHEVVQLDLSLELFLRTFTREGLQRMFEAVDTSDLTSDCRLVYNNRDRYLQVVDDCVAVLQQRDLAAVYKITQRGFLPEGPHFGRVEVRKALNSVGDWVHGDLSRHLSSVMFLDLIAFFAVTLSKHFGISRYAGKLATGLASFDPIAEELERPPNMYETILAELAADLFPPDLDLVGFTCPFPGNLMGALLLGKWLGEHQPNAKRALGGGYPSTELRSLEDPRVFDYMDYIVLDDGELPLRQICAQIEGTDDRLHSTFTRESDKVVFHTAPLKPIPFGELPPPDYEGLDLERYVHLIYRVSPVQRASEGTWLKLTAAHGCYWKRCTFCDISLPYIADYDPMPARRLADHMDLLHEQTGLSGFHFTDEAAPPALLFNLALELLRRKRSYHWWGNIRYDKAFEPDRCKLLAAAGMIMVTGGIETASDRVLEKIDKGVSVKQLVKVLQAFAEAGIGCHGYLIYGFPGETQLDTINGLEVLRQLMHAGLLKSGYFHQLSVSVHAPLGQKPELFNISLRNRPRQGFALNQVPFAYRDGVKRSDEILNRLALIMEGYQRGVDLDAPVLAWFDDIPMPHPTIARDLVARIANREPHPGMRERKRLVWLGGPPRWNRGLLTVRALSGRTLQRATTRDAFENLLRCYPPNWERDKPPTRKDFDSDDWMTAFWPVGLVAV